MTFLTSSAGMLIGVSNVFHRFKHLTPKFALHVEGTELNYDLTKWVYQVEFEHTLDMADMIKIRAINPMYAVPTSFVPSAPGPQAKMPDFTNHKAWAPGNECDLFIGYGEASDFIGRAIFTRHLPSFRDDRAPELVIVGYDRSHLMMGVSGELQGTNSNRPRLINEKDLRDEKDTQGKVWQGQSHAQIVTKIAERWKFQPDIAAGGMVGKHHWDDPDQGIIQPKDMSDYEMVMGLARLNNYDFWIDFNYPDRQWVLHWKSVPPEQAHRLVLKYGATDGTILSFRPEYGVQGAINELIVLGWDDTLQTWVNVIKIEDAEGEDPRLRPGAGLRIEPRKDRQATSYSDDEGFEDEEYYEDDDIGGTDPIVFNERLTSMTKFRLAAAGTAIDVISDRTFATAADLAAFATRWFIARRDSFLIGHGRLVGSTSIRAGETHRILGVGDRLSGDYYFTRVKHVLDYTGKGLPYITEFTANKVIRGDEG